MRRAVLFLLMGLLVFPMLSGCAKELTDEEMFAKLGKDKILAKASEIIAEKETQSSAEIASVTTDMTTAMTTLEPTNEITPEEKLLAPIALLGKEFNPFYEVTFPNGYEPYAAIFDPGDQEKTGKPNYVLFLTAKGDPVEIVKFVSHLAGFDDENNINSNVGGMNKEGYCTIDGTSNGKGMNIICQVKKTKEGGNYEECNDVDGCRLALTAFIDNGKLPQYEGLIKDNYNINIPGDLADYFAKTLLIDKCSITVNKQNPKFTSIYAVHQVEGSAALLKSMAAILKYDWYDDNGNSMGITYGRIYSDIKANVENNTIVIKQALNNADTASRDYVEPVTLSSLGFSYSDKDALCIYEDKQNGYRIAIHKPEWGQREDKWNIEFFHSVNSYNLVVWYIESEKRYTVQVDKGNSIAKYQYYMSENRYGDEYPNQETIQELFKKVFGDSGAYQYQEAIDMLNKYFKDTFGMTLEKLYALMNSSTSSKKTGK